VQRKKAFEIAEKLRQAITDSVSCWNRSLRDRREHRGGRHQQGSANIGELMSAADSRATRKEAGAKRAHPEADDLKFPAARDMEWAGRITSALQENRMHLLSSPLSRCAESGDNEYQEVLLRMSERAASGSTDALISVRSATT